MLLAEKANPLENLSRPLSGDIEPFLEIGILMLELLDFLRAQAGGTRSTFDCLHSRFCLKRATPERRQLVTEMPNELLELLERVDVRTFAV
jgi:hypothetical protein